MVDTSNHNFLLLMSTSEWNLGFVVLGRYSSDRWRKVLNSTGKFHSRVENSCLRQRVPGYALWQISLKIPPQAGCVPAAQTPWPGILGNPFLQCTTVQVPYRTIISQGKHNFISYILAHSLYPVSLSSKLVSPSSYLLSLYLIAQRSD